MLEELAHDGRTAAVDPSGPGASRAPPLVSLLLTAVVAGFGFTQLAGQLGVVLPAGLQRLYTEGGVGYDALLMAGDWLSPWKSQLVHGGPLHLLPNLAVIAVMSWRLERRLGPAALLLVAAASVAAGTLGIALLEDLPAVGSSVLAFGLWGAVLTMGLRPGGESGASGRRARRAVLDLALFAVLFGAATLSAGTTLVGHLCGLLGGATASLLAPIPRDPLLRQRRRQVAIHTGIALLLALSPGVVGSTLGSLPSLAGGLRVPTTVEGLSAPLALPARMARHPTTIDGLPAWRTSTVSDAELFAGVDRADPSATDQARRWESELGATLIADEAGQRWEGWRDLAWRVVDPATGRSIDRIEEHQRPAAGGLLRVGWRLGAARQPNRRALFDSVLAPLCSPP